MKLCIERVGCVDKKKDFSVAAHSDWGWSCEQLQITKSFNGRGNRDIMAKTEVHGDGEASQESHATLFIQ